MTKLETLIAELCPNGVEYKTLGDVLTIKNGKDYKSFASGSVPVYGSGGTMTYIDTAVYNQPSVLIPRKGSLGNVQYVDTPFWTVDTIFWTEINTLITIPRYIYHYLLSIHLEKRNKAGGVPSATQSDLNSIKIPIPPLEIQREIIHILDRYSVTTDELFNQLTAELTTRKKQYEYYRNELLAFGDDVPMRKLGEIARFRRGSFPQPYGNPEWYDGENSMPFVQVCDVSDDMLLVQDTKRKISKLAQPKSVFVPTGTVLVTLQGTIGRVAVTQYDCYVDRTLAIFESFKIEINKRYFAYQVKNKFTIEEKTARGSTIKTITKEEFTDFKIPVPSLSEQARIVEILDKFDTLTTDITKGLPAEIAARQKQYEYYRDKLLTFKEKGA
jgi:type I restriction enzyme S subunit